MQLVDRRAVASFVLIGLLPILPGCLGAMLEHTPRPGMAVESVEFAELSLQGVTLRWNVRVSNPYDVALPVQGIGYTLAHRGTEFLAGNAEAPRGIPARGSQTVAVPMRIGFASFSSQIDDAKPGAVIPYSGTVNLRVRAPVLGSLTLSQSKEAEIPVPAAPDVSLQALRWEELSLSRARARLTLGLSNPNAFGVDLQSGSYRVKLGGTEVARSGFPRGFSLEAGENQTIPLDLQFSPMQFGTGLYHLIRGSESPVALEGSMALDSRFGRFKAPLRMKDTVSATER